MNRQTGKDMLINISKYHVYKQTLSLPSPMIELIDDLHDLLQSFYGQANLQNIGENSNFRIRD